MDHKTLAAEFIKTKEDQNVDASFKYVASFLNDKLKDVPLEKSFYAEDGLVWRKFDFFRLQITQCVADSIGRSID